MASSTLARGARPSIRVVAIDSPCRKMSAFGNTSSEARSGSPRTVFSVAIKRITIGCARSAMSRETLSTRHARRIDVHQHAVGARGQSLLARRLRRQIEKRLHAAADVGQRRLPVDDGAEDFLIVLIDDVAKLQGLDLRLLLRDLRFERVRLLLQFLKVEERLAGVVAHEQHDAQRDDRDQHPGHDGDELGGVARPQPEHREAAPADAAPHQVADKRDKAADENQDGNQDCGDGHGAAPSWPRARRRPQRRPSRRT